MGRAKQLGKVASIREGRALLYQSLSLRLKPLYRACFSQAVCLNQPPQKHSVNKGKGKDRLRVSRATHVGFSPTQQYIPDNFSFFSVASGPQLCQPFSPWLPGFLRSKGDNISDSSS